MNKRDSLNAALLLFAFVIAGTILAIVMAE